MKKMLVSACAAALVISSTSVFAEQSSAIAVSAGAFNAFDGDSTAEVGVEYRFAPLESVLDIIPAVGISMNADGGYWGYAGIRYDIQLGSKWYLTPHVAVAAYEQGGGLDLGYDMEFRSGLDLAYQVTDASRVGVGVYHLSNNGLGDENPGAESVILTYSYTPDF